MSFTRENYLDTFSRVGGDKLGLDAPREETAHRFKEIVCPVRHRGAPLTPGTYRFVLEPERQLIGVSSSPRSDLGNFSRSIQIALQGSRAVDD
jgi:hypothetical protein